MHYTNQVLIDEVWEPSDLVKRDRSLVTVAALIATGKIHQLRFHLDYGRENGGTTGKGQV